MYIDVCRYIDICSSESCEGADASGRHVLGDLLVLLYAQSAYEEFGFQRV